MIFELVSKPTAETEVKLGKVASSARKDTVIEGSYYYLSDSAHAVDQVICRTALSAGSIGEEGGAGDGNFDAPSFKEELSVCAADAWEALSVVHDVVGGAVEARAVVGVEPVAGS